MERLFTDEELSYLPIGFQFFIKPDESVKPLPEFQEKEKFVKIEYYNTEQYKVHTHYKPISKMVKTQL